MADGQSDAEVPFANRAGCTLCARCRARRLSSFPSFRARFSSGAFSEDGVKNLDARCAPYIFSLAQFEKELTRERRARLRATTPAHTPARESPVRDEHHASDRSALREGHPRARVVESARPPARDANARAPSHRRGVAATSAMSAAGGGATVEELKDVLRETLRTAALLGACARTSARRYRTRLRTARGWRDRRSPTRISSSTSSSASTSSSTATAALSACSSPRAVSPRRPPSTVTSSRGRFACARRTTPASSPSVHHALQRAAEQTVRAGDADDAGPDANRREPSRVETCRAESYHDNTRRAVTDARVVSRASPDPPGPSPSSFSEEVLVVGARDVVAPPASLRRVSSRRRSGAPSRRETLPGARQHRANPRGS